jgi:hypothetical protein
MPAKNLANEYSISALVSVPDAPVLPPSAGRMIDLHHMNVKYYWQ